MFKDRARIQFTAIVIYIICAFAWWSVLLIKTADEGFQHQTSLLNYKSREIYFKLTIEALTHPTKGNYLIQIGENRYPIPLQNALDIVKKYPEFEIKFIDNILHIDIKDAAKLSLQQDRLKKYAMFIGESLSIGILLLWAFINLYRAINQKSGLQKQQNNFLMSITHELKTPISAIKLLIETILKRNLPESQVKSLAAKSIQETDRLSSLLDNIIIATRLDTKSNKGNHLFSISNMLKDIVNEYTVKWTTFQFSVNITPDIDINADPLLIRTLINNVLDNAIKYSPALKEISINLFVQDKYCHFIIADHGLGIPKSEQKKVFQKFYRIGNEETRNTKGTGLGLFIVHNIVKDLKGKVEIIDNIPQGTKFSIKIPIY